VANSLVLQAFFDALKTHLVVGELHFLWNYGGLVGGVAPFLCIFTIKSENFQ
jgi:hypothetical protein